MIMIHGTQILHSPTIRCQYIALADPSEKAESQVYLCASCGHLILM